MLKLKGVNKDYIAGNTIVKALKDVNLEFRENEFVSILGPSGSGKTTLLNIVGGLDHYTSGDMLINGMTTKLYRDDDWDSYRSSTIGFVFQNYYLIPHLNVLDNVEIALTISGVPVKERKARAIDALNSVGLGDQIHKKPNQLSGGQMQRVAIARALVNNPKILLADEPTGALDTHTSDQIMAILQEIAKDRLIIMVSHNKELVNKYSTRVVELLDGEVIADTNPYDSKIIIKEDKDIVKYNKGKKSSMSYLTALKLSFNNLRTKKARTIITSIAGSIGIIGIALVLAISNGMTTYVNSMQSDTLSGFPITITKQAMFTMPADGLQYGLIQDGNNDNDKIYPYDQSTDSVAHTNIIDDDYVTYLNAMDINLYNSISYTYGVSINLVGKTNANEYKSINTNDVNFQQLPTSYDFINTQYDLLSGNYPANSNEAILVIDKDNQVDVELLNALGIPYTEEGMSFNSFIGKTIKLVYNNNYYTYDNVTNTYIPRIDYEAMYNDANSKAITITGILRIKEDATSNVLSKGIAYNSDLNEILLDNCSSSDIVVSQKADTTRNVLTGLLFTPNEYDRVIMMLGGVATPVAVQIYPKSFDSKESIKAYLDAYNNGKAEAEQIIYSDLADMVTSVISTMIDTISIILSAFAAISLVVSSIMIGIITYVSVVERTKEIGILRSIGARKKDISRVFNAETVIIGLTAGIIGIAVTLLLSIPINFIVNRLVEVNNIASLPILSGIILVIVSMALTFIAGLIPSRIAAKKDPVVALRTE